MLRNTLSYKYAVFIGLFHILCYLGIILYGYSINPIHLTGYCWALIGFGFPIAGLLGLIIYSVGLGILVKDVKNRKDIKTLPVKKVSNIRIAIEIVCILIYFLQIIPTTFGLIMIYNLAT